MWLKLLKTFVAIRATQPRVLKSTGSLYLHCDPTASHYLKVLMDRVFGPECFQNEIVWKRTSSANNTHRWGPVHDVILFYSKGGKFTWNTVFQDFDDTYLEAKYRHKDERGVYRLSDLTAAERRAGDSGTPWKGFDPSKAGRHWAAPSEAVKLVGVPLGATTQKKLVDRT